jgi:two-component system, NtrC family, response regulator AtoC
MRRHQCFFWAKPVSARKSQRASSMMRRCGESYPLLLSVAPQFRLTAPRAKCSAMRMERRPGNGSAHVGLVEQAGSGTLFLDEVSTLPSTLQGKLLRLLEDGSYRKLGDIRETVSEARIISSSNADLPALAADGRFRADLYYRLNAIELHIPPLRARIEDIIPLAEHLLTQCARRMGQRTPSLLPAARAALCEHAWPGNIRELRNRVERALGSSGSVTQLTASALFPEKTLLEYPGNRIASLAEARERTERLQIEEAIRQTGGEIGKAAALLGVSRTTLWEKMRRLNLQ